jgi:hypothetical protein
MYNMINLDAFEWLAKRRPRSVHAVVTDPPFGLREYLPEELKHRAKGRRGVWRLPQSFDGCKRMPVPRFTVLGDRDIESLIAFHTALAKGLHRVLVPGAHVILASQNLLAHIPLTAFGEAGFEIRGQIARVVKTLRGGDRPKGGHREYPDVSVVARSMWEPWLVFRKPCEGTVRENLSKWSTGGLRRPCTDRPFSDLIMSRPASKAERSIAPHPSLKPQGFMRQIVRASLPLGKGVILDPFMGSGSTVAGAAAIGLRSIGLEIDAKFFAMASRAVPKLAELVVADDRPLPRTASAA